MLKSSLLDFHVLSVCLFILRRFSKFYYREVKKKALGASGPSIGIRIHLRVDLDGPDKV